MVSSRQLLSPAPEHQGKASKTLGPGSEFSDVNCMDTLCVEFLLQLAIALLRLGQGRQMELC